MKIPKPTDADRAYFRELFEGRAGVEVKPMFGNVAAFVNGNMAAGLFGSSLGIRLSPEDRAALMAMDGAGTFGPPDRPMKEYVTLPSAWREDSEQTEAWIRKGLDHTSSMPPKKKKKK